jgi:AraC-like DNA-binding protein
MVATQHRFADAAGPAPFYAGRVIISGHWRTLRRIDYFEVFAVVGGGGSHTVSSDSQPGVSEQLLPGRMFLFRPRDEQTIEAGPHGLTIAHVNFPVSSWQSFTSLAAIEPFWLTSQEPPQAEFDPADPAVLEPFELAVERFRNGPTQLDLIRFWLDIIPVLESSWRDHRELHAPEWLLSGIDALQDEANLRHGVPRLQQLSHVSPSSLSRAVRQFFGMTPTELVSRMRLQHAALLLSTTKASVGAISDRCGFSSQQYFSTCFRRSYLVSPREYRSRALAGFVEPVR